MKPLGSKMLPLVGFYGAINCALTKALQRVAVRLPNRGTKQAKPADSSGKEAFSVKAVVYKEPFRVDVEEAEDAKVLNPTDIEIRITSTAICGSDLHMYEGRTGAQPTSDAGLVRH